MDVIGYLGLGLGGLALVALISFAALNTRRNLSPVAALPSAGEEAAAVAFIFTESDEILDLSDEAGWQIPVQPGVDLLPDESPKPSLARVINGMPKITPVARSEMVRLPGASEVKVEVAEYPGLDVYVRALGLVRAELGRRDATGVKSCANRLVRLAGLRSERLSLATNWDRLDQAQSRAIIESLRVAVREQGAQPLGAADVAANIRTDERIALVLLRGINGLGAIANSTDNEKEKPGAARLGWEYVRLALTLIEIGVGLAKPEAILDKDYRPSFTPRTG